MVNTMKYKSFGKLSPERRMATWGNNSCNQLLVSGEVRQTVRTAEVFFFASPVYHKR